MQYVLVYMFICSAWPTIQVEQKSIYNYGLQRNIHPYSSTMYKLHCPGVISILHPSPLISILNACVGTEETIRLESTE